VPLWQQINRTTLHAHQAFAGRHSHATFFPAFLEDILCGGYISEDDERDGKDGEGKWLEYESASGIKDISDKKKEGMNARRTRRWCPASPEMAQFAYKARRGWPE